MTDTGPEFRVGNPDMWAAYQRLEALVTQLTAERDEAIQEHILAEGRIVALQEEMSELVRSRNRTEHRLREKLRKAGLS